MSRILITGISGVLGTSLRRELLSRGHEVFGCDLQHSSDPAIFRADISEYRQLERVFNLTRPDIVYSLAGEFGRLNGRDFAENLWRTNCLGNHNVIDLCVRHCARLIFASSSEAYGSLADDSDLMESLLFHQVPVFKNEYSLTKWAGEKQIEIACNNSGLRAVSLRFFNVYGEENYSPYRSVVCRFIYRLLHRQPITVHKGSRDFLYITDWTNTVANVADRFDALKETAYNIGGMERTEIYDLAEIVREACGAERGLVRFTDPEKGNVMDKMPDTRLAQRDLGHSPVVGLREGIRMTVEWMRRRYPIEKAMTVSASV